MRLHIARSVEGQTRKSGDAITTSAFPPTADIPESDCEVRKVPYADMTSCEVPSAAAGRQGHWLAPLSERRAHASTACAGGR
jgi:hypothetical protein